MSTMLIIFQMSKGITFLLQKYYREMIDWLIVGCLMSSGKYFMHNQDENKFTINTIGRPCHKTGHLGWWSGKFGLPLENEGIQGWFQVFSNGSVEHQLGNFYSNWDFVKHKIWNEITLFSCKNGKSILLSLTCTLMFM